MAFSFFLLLGFVGLSIDLGAAFAKRQEVQNGADAAAIAVASECLINKTPENCPGDYAAAESIALLNERADETARVEPGAIAYHSPEDFHVTVTVTADQRTWFLPAIIADLDAVTVRRAATVNYGSPIEGTTTLPVAAGNCIFPEAPIDPDEVVEVEIWLPTSSGGGPSGGDVEIDCRPDYPAGGFAWLEKAPDGEDCTAYVGVGDDVDVISNPGGPPPSECPDDRFAQMAINQEIVFIPLFDISSGSGAGGGYDVTRFAIFQVTGFHSQHGWVDDGPSDEWCKYPPEWALNGGNLNYNNTTCFKGNLLGFHDEPGDFKLGGPFTEATFLRLVG